MRRNRVGLTSICFVPFILILFYFCPSPLLAQKVLLGIDVLQKDNFSILNGKNVGLITNQTGTSSKLETTIDLFRQAKNFKLISVYSPEHGVKGLVAAGQSFNQFTDSVSGITFYALYGKTAKPSKEMLRNIDVLVYDIQDIGVRSYTYISTLGLAMEAAAENKIPFIILDRPNPLGGWRVEGNVAEEDFKSFVSKYEIPYVYGLTCGELANLINTKRSIGNKIKCNLQVVKMEGWKRWMKFSDTGLIWVPTSPNVPYQETPFLFSVNRCAGRTGCFSVLE